MLSKIENFGELGDQLENTFQGATSNKISSCGTILCDIAEESIDLKVYHSSFDDDQLMQL